MTKVFIETYGCTLNQAESDIMAAILKERGHALAVTESDADVILINTCTVKGATENKIIERLKKLGDAGRIFVVAGCLSADEARLRKFAPDAPIVKTMAIARIADAVEDAMAGQATIFRDYEPKENLPRQFSAPILRVPVNDGCVGHCNYCQTKMARPFLRSYSPKAIAKWINEGVARGAREIQLTSQDLGAYGLDIRTDLLKLMEHLNRDDSEGRRNALFAGTGPVSSPDPQFMIRLGMINPNHASRMREGLAQILLQPNIYRFLHIPLQSGSEKVCKEMERDHTVSEFEQLVAFMRERVPQITVATDLIAGYPTESEEDFQQTLELVRRVRPDIVNVSKFSPRPGTRAKEMKQIDNNTIKRRSTELSSLVREISRERNRALVGNEFRVLITEKQRDFTGRTPAYKQVVVRDFKGKLGDFINVKITDANHGSLFGGISVNDD